VPLEESFHDFSGFAKMIIAKTCADVLPFDFALSPGGYFSDKVIFFEVDWNHNNLFIFFFFLIDGLGGFC
jgi:hypothetical protein